MQIIINHFNKNIKMNIPIDCLYLILENVNNKKLSYFLQTNKYNNQLCKKLLEDRKIKLEKIVKKIEKRWFYSDDNQHSMVVSNLFTSNIQKNINNRIIDVYSIKYYQTLLTKLIDNPNFYKNKLISFIVNKNSDLIHYFNNLDDDFPLKIQGQFLGLAQLNNSNILNGTTSLINNNLGINSEINNEINYLVINEVFNGKNKLSYWNLCDINNIICVMYNLGYC